MEGKVLLDTLHLNGWSTIDIDNEIDFRLAESVAQFIPFEHLYKPIYYQSNTFSTTMFQEF